MKQFEGGNVHLAECAQRLTRMVNYEVPALKQQIARCKQVQRVRPLVCVCVCVCVCVFLFVDKPPFCALSLCSSWYLISAILCAISCKGKPLAEVQLCLYVPIKPLAVYLV